MIKVSIIPAIHPRAYETGEHSSDYMMDQVYHGLRSLPDVQVKQYPPNPLMFKTCSKEYLERGWGKSFTLYGLLDEETDNFALAESDLIIIPLHHTCVNYQDGLHRLAYDVIRMFNKPTIIIDGWDQPYYNSDLAKTFPYFKRELYDDDSVAIPIFFGIPKEKFYFGNLNKLYDFSPMVPANFSWGGVHTSNYIYKTEEEYYDQYRKSYFGYSCKKGGYATGRQNEIIAQGCLPYITDIEGYPKNCLFRYPKELCIEIKKMKGVYPGTINPFNPSVNTFIGDTRQIKEGEERGCINHDEFDVNLYYDYVDEIQTYAYTNLTTEALAKYVLEKSL